VTKSIYVGNLPWSASETEIRELFEQYGTVHGVAMITDRYTGAFRGFAFVQMEENEATTAIAALNGTKFGGRRLRVAEGRERRSGRGDRRDRRHH